jgi:lipoteichoic acid synthase
MFEGTLPAYIGHEPFSVYYMTVSGHAPYEKSSPLVKKYYDTVNEICGDAFYEKTKYYICYQMELENALSSMVNMLEEAGIADDTVIVMTGDHYPYGLGSGKTWKNDRDYIDDLIKADDALYWNEDKSGLIIWSGALEGELKPYVCEVSEPVSSLDILPTVSNLFGLEFDSRLLPGRDVFAENTDPLVFWNNRSWITEEGKYDTRKRVFYPDEEGTGAELTPEQLAETNALVEDKILMCGQIMKLDYYGLAFGPDESEDRQEEIWKLLQQEAAERGHYEKTEDTSGADHGA